MLFTTDLYLEAAEGASPERLAASYGLTKEAVAERLEAARLCYELQVVMDDFPFELLVPSRQINVC